MNTRFRGKISWQDFEKHFAWNTHRAKLLGGLKAACISLLEAGCKIIWIDGSFISEKTHPNDVDVAWDDSTVDFSGFKK